MADKRIGARRMLKLYLLYARMDLNCLTQDTKAFFIMVISDLLSSIASVSAVLLLAVRFGGVGGLNYAETLFMLGYSTLVSGLFTVMFCSNNVGYISRRIGRSQIDHMLIQPLPLGAQLMAEGFMPFSGIGPLACGAIVTAAALHELGGQTAWWFYPALIFLLICSTGIIMGMSYLIAVTAFYRPVSCEEISTIMIDALSTLDKFPLGGISALLQALLITVLPAGLLGWLPALLLLGKAPLLPGILLPASICALSCALAALGFRKGMRHYVRVGSNRYRAIGHRN